MHVAVVSLAALAVAVLIILLVGAILPEKHVATRTYHFDADPEKVWNLITDFQGQTRWRPKLERVERLPSQNGHEVWREVEGRRRQLSFETVECSPPHILVRRIVDEGLPFGGSWTFEIVPDTSGSRLTITENGEVRNALFRFVSRFIIGHTTGIETYASNLRQALASGPAGVQQTRSTGRT
jgi:uncharacterized protein YndB with AHSA1/START domain